jgi:hypothetical protein
VKINLSSKSDRLNNLYSIVNREGQSIPLRLNTVQQEVCDNTHNRKLILKARQLGMSTYAVLDILDDAIFTPHVACGIVSYSLEHAQHIFRRIIGHAIDNFYALLRPHLGIITRSAREITFANGSVIRVDTTLRGGTYLRLLLSEFGKTCARSPIKAEEVVTGTLQTVPPNGRVIIESTAEGNEGFFADMVYHATQRGNADLSELDYHLFFYPWHREPAYALANHVSRTVEIDDYFKKIEGETGCFLSSGQRNWYCQQIGLLGDKIKQEFPSTISEAFLASTDAYYYGQGVESAYKDNRVLETQIYDPLYPVYIAMDIGATDMTVIVFFQLVHGERRYIDFYEDTGKGVEFYAKFLLQDKPYLLHTIFLPHDAAHRDGIIVENTYEKEFKKCFTGTNTRFVVLKRHDLNLGISQSKLGLARSVFHRPKCKKLLDHLAKYRKKWSEATGHYLDDPFHDVHSHYADAFRYSNQAILHLESFQSQSSALQKHKEVVEGRRRII